MSATATDRPVRLLHLSGLNFGTDMTGEADSVLRGLVAQVRKDVAAGQVPDLVVITGDLAFSGKAKEYDQARDWLDLALWPALCTDPSDPFAHDRLLLVPGNHDVDRSKVDEVAEMVQDRLLAKEDQEKIAAVLGDAGQRKALVKRHAAYLAFCRTWFGQAQPLPWWQRSIPIHGQRLHVAGLDSAWMSGGDEDCGRLLLGRYQIHQTLPPDEGADWRLALIHHPWEYLAAFDLQKVRPTIQLHYDLLLRGHRHEPEAYRIVPADPKRACLELAAGGVYHGSRHPNAFQWIELHPNPRRVRVLLRTWIKGEWTRDGNQPGDDDGAVDIPLGPPSATGVTAPVSQAPVVPTAYLDWLRRTYSSVDLLGQETQQGQAVTLGQVYVPAVTTPAGPSDNRPRDAAKEPPALLLARIDASSLYCPAPAGAGKSTFCRWAVLQSIPGAPAAHPVPPPDGYAEPVALRTRLPLLVPLREFWEIIDCGQGRRLWNRDDLTDTLAAWVDTRLRPDGLDGTLLKAHLAAGSAFLLLDGLDEVPVSLEHGGVTRYPRTLLLAGLADALPHWEQGNRLLLTSRPYGLDAAELARLQLPHAPLEPLPEPLQELFVRRWFTTLNTPEQSAGLLATIGERADLAPLAENPLLLAALCVIHGTGKRLPEDRYHLYQRIVDIVLFNRYRGDTPEREPIKARLEAIAYGMHTGEGLDEDRRTPNPEAGAAELERLLRAFAALDPAHEAGRVAPAVWREQLLTRSGLLVPRSDGRAAFRHLSFQEFLAAERIAHTSDDNAAWERVFHARGPTPQWHDTLVFLFAGGVFNYRRAQWGLDLLTRLAADLDRTGVAANPAPAVLIAAALEICIAKGYAIPAGLAEGFRRTCIDAIADAIAIPARQALGLCLGRLGDPRIPGLCDPAGYCEVLAGDYPYGENNETIAIAAPFLLGRYPVTNSQYAQFMADGGYTNRAWWSDAGWAWLLEEKVTEPPGWGYRKWNGPNQPVVGVSFWEAQACCHWAGGRLPTEHEWEAAARGPEGYKYPWGDAWENGICNSDAAGLGGTSPVGLFPRSCQARLGIEDLAGNVWEWCDDFWDKSAGGSSRVVRGGAFDVPAGGLRSSDRFWGEPVYRVGIVGFRCVLAAPRQP